MSELNAQIGQLLKDLREERGWSLRELGLVVGMNKSYLGDIELGKRNPSINSLEKIVAGYDLTVEGVLRQDTGLMNAPEVLLEQRFGACYNAKQSVPRPPGQHRLTD